MRNECNTNKWRRLFVTLMLTSFLLVIGSNQASHAIFGLSKCEKLKKSINLEESIGLASWKIWNSTRLSWQKQNAATNVANSDTLVKLLLPISQSDVNVYNMAMKAPQCFDASKDAWIRSSLNSSNNDVDSYNKYLNNPYAAAIPMSAFYNTYTKYYSVYGNLLGS